MKKEDIAYPFPGETRNPSSLTLSRWYCPASEAREKLIGSDHVAEDYKKTIQAYVEKGYLRKFPLDEQLPNTVWYFPHVPVVRTDKTTTKARIVFDCAAKCNGIYLNDMIYAGPKLQQDLFNVLVRFRRNPVGIACAIKEMYLQIEINENDLPISDRCGETWTPAESRTYVSSAM